MHAQLTPDNVLPFRPLTSLLPPRQPLQFCPSGSEIFGQGEPVGPVYQVDFGAVRVYRLLPTGVAARCALAAGAGVD